MSVVDLNTLPQEDTKHFILCPVCNIYIDCRDLGEVFEHMHDPNLKSTSAEGLIRYTVSQRADEPNIEYLNNKDKTKVNAINKPIQAPPCIPSVQELRSCR
jgi:hypothetical protein